MNPPVITTLLPTTGEPTTVITISDSGFGSTQSNSTVAVGGINAPVTSWSDGQIIASVPTVIWRKQLDFSVRDPDTSCRARLPAYNLGMVVPTNARS
jgi:IPT/TIG domain